MAAPVNPAQAAAICAARVVFTPDMLNALTIEATSRTIATADSGRGWSGRVFAISIHARKADRSTSLAGRRAIGQPARCIGLTLLTGSLPSTVASSQSAQRCKAIFFCSR
jgi:hypothetical protein